MKLRFEVGDSETCLVPVIVCSSSQAAQATLRKRGCTTKAQTWMSWVLTVLDDYPQLSPAR
jgi:hypothetical protein